MALSQHTGPFCRRYQGSLTWWNSWESSDPQSQWGDTFLHVAVSVGAKWSQSGWKQTWPTSIPHSRAFNSSWNGTQSPGDLLSLCTDPNPLCFSQSLQKDWSSTTPKITAQFLFLFCSTDLQEDWEPRLGWEGSFSPCFCVGWPHDTPQDGQRKEPALLLHGWKTWVSGAVKWETSAISRVC